MGNALVQKWLAFVFDGEIVTQEFLDALKSIEAESWDDALVKSFCPPGAEPNPNHLCYPVTGGAASVGHVTSDRILYPLPTGVVEYPFTMVLTTGGSATAQTGRVVSAETLQYPGNPTVTFGRGQYTSRP